MANTLTNLIPTLYEALDIVSRELTGLIPAVTLDATAEQAAKDQTIRSPVAPVGTVADITPGLYAPDTGDNVFTNKTLTISKSRMVPIRWNGEEVLSLAAGITQQRLMRDQMAQAMRALANEIEADLAALYVQASRGYGGATTTPFGTAGDYTDASNIRRILVDNGAPTSDLQLVVNTVAGANIRGKQAQAHIAGDTTLQRQGVLLDYSGITIRESAQIKSHTAGTASSATTDNAGYAVGATTLTLASAGTGTLLPGDIITLAADTTRKYGLFSGDADVSGGGTFVLNAPGLTLALSAATKAIAVTATYTANMAFARNAIVLATRLPAMPPGGDIADDVITITDTVSGLSFQVATYRQYRQYKIEVGIAWGVAVIKPEHLAILIG